MEPSAQQLSQIHLENVRLLEAQQKQLREMGILFETISAISSSLELEEVLSTVARHMAAALEVSSCSISDWDPARDVVTTLAAEAATADLAATLTTGDIGQSYSLADYPSTARVVRDRQPVVVQVSDPEADQAERALLAQLGQKSLLMMPLLARDCVVGLLELYESRQSREFSADDLRLCQALANQAAVAINNARLYEQTDERLRARVDELTALQRTSQELNATLELDRILQLLLEQAVRTTRASHGNVMLIDLDTGWLVLRTAYGYSAAEEAAIRQRLLQPGQDVLAAEVTATGQARIVPDAACESYAVCVRGDTRSALVAPIFYQGAVVGLINLRHIAAGAFDPEDLKFVQALAEQAAIAIGNALRYEEQVRANVALRQRTEQMAGLLAVSQKLHADLPLADTLEEVAYAIQETVGFDIVMISIVDDPRSSAPLLHRVAAAGLPLELFEEAKRVRQPLERYERLLRDEYRQGLCYFFPFQRQEDWTADLHTVTRLPAPEEWHEGQWHSNDMLLAPMRGAGGRLLGHISVDEPRDGLRPNQRTLDVLAIFASQAAIAVENANLYAEARRRGDNLALINEVGRALTQLVEPEQVLATVVKAVGLLLRCEMAAVMQPDPVDGTFAAVASLGVDPAALSAWRFAPGDGLVGHVAQAAVSLLIPDTDREPDFVPAPVPLGSMMLVPIAAGRQVIGVMVAGSPRKHALAEADKVLLSTLADQAAVALESTRLFQQTRRRVAELATINEIGRAISRAMDVDQLASLMYDQVSNLLDTRSFYIALHQPATELVRVEFLVQRGQHLPPLVFQLGQGLTSHLLRTGEPILFTHGTGEFEPEFGLAPEGESPKSWLGVPMIAEDRVIGAIVAQSYDREDAFDEAHLELLMTISGQAAITYQSASLFQEGQRRIEQLNVLNQIAQALSSTLELDELLALVYQQVSRIVVTANFYIALLDEAKDEINFPFVVDPEGREDWQPCAKGEGLTGTVIATAKPLLLPTGAAGRYGEANREVDAGLCRSWLGVPMIAEDKVVGVIAVQDYEREHVYSEEHLNLLSTVAAQAAVAVRNAQLYRQIVRLNEELEAGVQERTQDLARAMDELTVERDRVTTLYRISSELGTSLELDRVLRRALQLFADALGLEHGSILLVDQATGRLSLRATLESGRRLPRGGKPTPWRSGEGLAGWVLEHREPVLVADVNHDPRWRHRPRKPLNIRSVVAAPLSLGGGDVLGVLVLGHPQVEYFTPQHLQLVTAAAAQIATAVNNADLYAFITDQADQLGAALQAQQEEAAKNRAILQSIADGVLVLDHNGKVLLVNPAAEELLGFSGLALQDGHFRHMVGLGDTPTHRELAQALYAELRERLEAEGRRDFVQPGTVRLEAENKVLAVNIAPLVVSLGDLPGLVAALRDISREAEVERLKNEFISTVSHELRTPMTSIKGYTDLLFLGMAGGLTDAQRNFLKIIKSNADRLTALVNDILDISRIETGRMHLTIEPLDLGELITQVVASFQGQYRDKGLALQWHEPSDLPEVRGDEARVTQVLNNLIANAWQYTPADGQVTISIKPADGFLQVDVTDTGIGISPSDVGRIFDRFYRADHPVVQEAEGTGLGLSIVKMFVEMLGGEIWVASKLDVGSTFSFTLPLQSGQVPEPVPDLLSAELATRIGRRPKILVVEDNRDLALLLRRQLESEGYEVLLAGTGEDALWLAKESHPQLIILDIMLPDMNGFAVLELLKRNPVTSAIPVVIVSVLTDTEKGYALGAVDYLVKPFAEEQLLGVVRQAMASSGQAGPNKLLVADDDPEVLAALQAALSLHGYEVSTVLNGQEVLNQVHEFQPDVILLDTKMPGMDGYEVIRRLKSEEATSPIPVIVLTSSPVDKERDRGRVLGKDIIRYLSKPLSIELLIREIKKTIAERPST